MRRIVIAIGSTLTGLVLLFSWPTSLNRAVATAATETTGATSGSTGTSSAGTGSTDSGAGTDTGSSSSTDTQSAAPATTTETYVGSSVSTRYGPVQVQVTVTDGTVTAAEAIDYPNANPKDQQINGYAIPVLNAEAVEAQSSSIQMVSGATFTSDAYISSLQSALDQAGL